MNESIKIEGIVLEVVKHNDRHNVVTLFTRSHGRMAFLVPVGKTAKARSKVANLMLLSSIRGETRIKSGRELHFLSNYVAAELWKDLYFNPVKSSLIFFISEFLNKFLRESPPDTGLWDFIRYSLHTLDSLPTKSITNFHLTFLIGLLHLSGIAPVVEHYDNNKIFDMQSAEFIYPELFLSHSSALLTHEESGLIPLILKMNYRNMNRFRFSRAERNRLLDKILQYFSLHLPISVNFKSLPILQELFS